MDIDEAPRGEGVTGHEENDIFAETSNLEARFYAEGYQSGFEHGKLHGLFEGRALGCEKCFEIWEEVGFYEGYAGFWIEVLGSIGDALVEEGGGAGQGKTKGKDARALNHAKQLLSLIDTFPTSNPTPTTSQPKIPTSQTIQPVSPEMQNDIQMDIPITLNTTSQPQNEVDLTALLSSIRARYKLLCVAVGARPRLQIAAMPDGTSSNSGMVEGGAMVEGIEGPMKGVDTRQLRY